MGLSSGVVVVVDEVGAVPLVVPVDVPVVGAVLVEPDDGAVEVVVVVGALCGLPCAFAVVVDVVVLVGPCDLGAADAVVVVVFGLPCVVALGAAAVVVVVFGAADFGADPFGPPTAGTDVRERIAATLKNVRSCMARGPPRTISRKPDATRSAKNLGKTREISS